MQWKTIEEEKKQVAKRIKEQHTKYMMDPMEHTGDLDKPSSALKVAERKWDEQLSEDKRVNRSYCKRNICNFWQNELNLGGHQYTNLQQTLHGDLNIVQIR